MENAQIAGGPEWLRSDFIAGELVAHGDILSADDSTLCPASTKKEQQLMSERAGVYFRL